MSPASSGSLEVERYIGACLITQHRANNSNKPRDFYPREQYVSDVYQPNNYVNLDARYRVQRCNSVDVWAGGMPLISFANGRRGRQDGLGSPQRTEDVHNPLARLAVHTQGAPLILTKSYNHRKNKVNRSNKSNKPESDKKINGGNKCLEGPQGVDTVSVASDESSASGNSENCLPRIIKPRKRRKKDRKPPLLGRPLSQDGFSTDSASPDIDSIQSLQNRPFIHQFNFDSYHPFRTPEPTLSQLIATSNLIERYQPLQDISETPNLHHSFEDIEDLDDGKDINGNQSTSTCQCRYCDPSGQIWDVERSCYSPFLTPPKPSFQFPNLDNYYSPVADSDSHCLVHSMSSVSLEEDKKRSGARDLEVSTEIVTSLNGHRDLEIKFFSTPSADSVRDTKQSDCEIKCAVNNLCGLVAEE